VIRPQPERTGDALTRALSLVTLAHATASTPDKSELADLAVTIFEECGSTIERVELIGTLAFLAAKTTDAEELANLGAYLARRQ
jgi:hypothetical protein